MLLKSLISAMVFTIVLSAFPLHASADSNITVNGKTYTVTDTQAAEFAVSVVKTAADNHVATPSETVETKISHYAEFGRIIGASLAGTAKELGVAVNDFSQTRIGVVSTWILVYKLIGADIIQKIAAFLWFTVALPTWFWNWRRVAIWKSVKTTVDEKGKKVTEYVFYGPTDNIDGIRGGFLFVLAVIVALGFIVAFA